MHMGEDSGPKTTVWQMEESLQSCQDSNWAQNPLHCPGNMKYVYEKIKHFLRPPPHVHKNAIK